MDEQTQKALAAELEELLRRRNAKRLKPATPKGEEGDR